MGRGEQRRGGFQGAAGKRRALAKHSKRPGAGGVSNDTTAAGGCGQAVSKRVVPSAELHFLRPLGAVGSDKCGILRR